ncbi:MAG: LamG-like jellyroll fold domain-containing protein [Bacteroidota bacterium]
MKKYYFTFVLVLTISILFAQHTGQQAIFNATSNSYIDYGKGINLSGYNNKLSNGTAMTITMWVKWGKKTAAGVGEWANLFTLADTAISGDNGVFWVQHNQTNTKFEFALNTQTSGRQYIQSNTNPVDGVWYHIACVYDASLSTKNMKLYINGILEAYNDAKGNITIFGSKSKLNVGRWPNPTNNYRFFDGMIDEISVWSKPLSTADIVSIMNNPESVTGRNYNAAKLIGYYNFDTGTPLDLSSSGNNGTNAGGVTFTNSGSLPVELINFDVTLNNGKSLIQWSTATETNNNFFTVERSFDGVTAETIAVVNGSGNSNVIVNYNQIDQDTPTGIVYYRIKQTDFDGTTETFAWKAVNTSSAQTSLLKVYPNPSNGILNVSMTGISSAQTTLNIFDITGRQVMSQQFESKDFFTTTLDLSSMIPAGLYYVEVINDSQRLIEKIILK